MLSLELIGTKEENTTHFQNYHNYLPVKSVQIPKELNAEHYI
jgi:hypothetical protein